MVGFSKLEGIMAKKVVSDAAKKSEIKHLSRCGLHPKYKGIMPPRVDCLACKIVYDERRGA